MEDPDQPRQVHDEESLDGLAASIQQHGVLQPISVSPLANVNMFKIITGERRWRAAQRAGLDVMPCIIKQIEGEDILTQQLIENLQREDLQPLEKAKGIAQVKETLGATNREVGSRLGLSERSVGYLLDLMDLPESISREVTSSPNRPADGKLTEKHARFLRQLNDMPEVQSAVVDRIREEKFTGEQTAGLVKAIKKRPEKADEIARSPLDHLNQFFRDEEPFEAVVEEPGAPRTVPVYVQLIREFQPVLDGVNPSDMSRPEVQMLQDALTAMKVAVDGLLRECRLELGEPVG